MNSNVISAPISATLALMVQYTRDRRCAHEAAIVASSDNARRLHNSRYQQLSQAMTHTTLKALRAGWDMDTLSWIVQVATDAQLTELGCADGDHATLSAMITAMRTAAPVVVVAKPRTTRKPKAMNADEIQTAVKALRQCGSRLAARTRVLELFRLYELRQIAKALDLGTCSKLRRNELIEHMIDFTVQARLDHAAIMNA